MIIMLALCAQVHAGTPFRVSIVPTKSRTSERSITAAPRDPDTFYVVVTNVSSKAQPVWEGWNSWGYRNVSFALILADGTKHDITRKAQGFTRNFPSTFIIEPGESQVYPIKFDSTWDGLPTLNQQGCCATSPVGGSLPIRLRAIYDVETSSEALQQEVWVGRVESPTYDLTLRWWR